MDKISIVIPTYNRPEWMLKTLQQVIDQNHGAICEILLIDQTPWFAIPIELQKEILKIKENNLIEYHQLDFPNLPHARNYALNIAKGNIILFLDDDVLLPQNFIVEHLICYKNPDVIAVTGELYQRKDGFLLSDLKIENPENGSYKVYNNTYNYEHAQHLSGGNHSVKMEYALKCGGYDENLTTLGEDVDFTNRLKNILITEKIAFNPKAFILHLRAPTGGCRLSGKSSISEYKHLMGQFLISLRYSKKTIVEILLENIRLGPFRKENVLQPWRQPYAWFSYFKAMVLANKNKNQIKNQHSKRSVQIL